MLYNTNNISLGLWVQHRLAHWQPFVLFLTIPHSCAPLVSHVRCIPDRCGQVCEDLRHAEACAIPCVADHCRAGATHFSALIILLHLHAALAIQGWCAFKHNGHLYEVSRSADACVTGCDASHIPEPQTKPGHGIQVVSLIIATPGLDTAVAASSPHPLHLQPTIMSSISVLSHPTIMFISTTRWH